ncbi:hypothetical protein [Streptodolium elevatio]
MGVGSGRFTTDEAGSTGSGRCSGTRTGCTGFPLHPGVLYLDEGLAAVSARARRSSRAQFTDSLPPLIADWELVDVTLPGPSGAGRRFAVRTVGSGG